MSTVAPELVRTRAALPMADDRHDRAARWGLLFAVILAAGIVFYVLPFPIEVKSKPNDESWRALLSLAFLAHKQFGMDVQFTYGPWGFLINPRNVQGIYKWVILGRLILAAGCCAGMATAAARWIRELKWQLLWAGCVLLLVEPTYLLTPLLFLLMWREPAPKGVTENLALHVLALAAGLAANTKFTCFLLLAAMVPALSIGRQSRALVITAISSWLISWVVAGQGLLLAGHYVLVSLRMAVDYSGAMAVEGWARARLFAVVLCGVPPALCVVAETRKRFTVQDAALVCWLACFEYVALGQSLVRCDVDHLITGLVAMAFPVGLMILANPHLWRGGLGTWDLYRAGVNGLVIVTGLAILLLVAPQLLLNLDEFVRAVLQTPAGWAGKLPGTDASQAMAKWGKEGTDVFPLDLSYAIRHGYALSNRPTIQSYAACSQRVMATNAEFMRGPDRPGRVLLEVAPIDQHYPTAEDALCWRAFLENYQPAGREDRYLVLSRRSETATLSLELLADIETRLAQSVEVPAVSNGIVWAEISVQPNWFGRLRAIGMNRPHLWLSVETANGWKRFEYWAGSETGGFLLSPYVDSTAVLERIYQETVPEDRRVRRIELSEAGAGWTGYRQPVSVKLYHLLCKDHLRHGNPSQRPNPLPENKVDIRSAQSQPLGLQTGDNTPAR
jgi:hypothetical protein